MYIYIYRERERERERYTHSRAEASSIRFVILLPPGKAATYAEVLALLVTGPSVAVYTMRAQGCVGMRGRAYSFAGVRRCVRKYTYRGGTSVGVAEGCWDILDKM